MGQAAKERGSSQGASVEMGGHGQISRSPREQAQLAYLAVELGRGAKHAHRMRSEGSIGAVDDRKDGRP